MNRVLTPFHLLFEPLIQNDVTYVDISVKLQNGLLGNIVSFLTMNRIVKQLQKRKLLTTVYFITFWLVDLLEQLYLENLHIEGFVPFILKHTFEAFIAPS